MKTRKTLRATLCGSTMNSDAIRRTFATRVAPGAPFLLCMAFAAQAVLGATFNVNGAADTLDVSPGNGACADGSGNCTLRAAIGEANALAGDDIINLPAGIYTTTLPTTGENANADGDLDITGNTVIAGAGQATVFVEAAIAPGTATDRVFDIQAGAVVTIQGLTVRNGRITGLSDRTRGGGIRNLGTLTLNNATVRDNQAIGADVGSAGIRNDGPGITLDGVTVTGNLCDNSTANCFGGGMYESGDGATATISNSIITGNTSQSTGANRNGFAAGFGKEDGGTLTIQNSAFSNNIGNGAGDGGGSDGTGIRIRGSDTGSSTPTTIVTISDSTISGNIGNTPSGVVHTGAGIGITATNELVDVTLTNVTVSLNSGSLRGAGLSIGGFGANVTINDSSITSNTLRGALGNNAGAGIFVDGATSLELNNTQVAGNSANGGANQSSGGGIHTFDSTVVLNNCNVSNNKADLYAGIRHTSGAGNRTTTLNGTTVSGNAATDGGGIGNVGTANLPTSTVTLNGSTVSGNRATGAGGGLIQSGFGTLIFNVNNSTIAGNIADSDDFGVGDDGGGIAQLAGTVNVKSSIVGDNTVGTAGTGPDCFGTLTSGDYNLIENTAGCTVAGTTANNITGTDPNLGPLADNGGPTRTHAVLAGSPVIDKASSFGSTTDQRGLARPFDNPAIPNAAGGDGADIGAFEVQPTTPERMEIDARTVTGTSSNANGVLESGETVQVAPFWHNTLTAPQAQTGAASNLSGPAGPAYTIDDGSADYGSIPAQSTADCHTATADCYRMTVSGARPTAHWDATFTEELSANNTTNDWALHVGETFPDVPTTHLFYAFVENLFHNGVTGGCGGGNYCPGNPVTRAQMAVFLLKGKLGASHVPLPAIGIVFLDVGPNDFAAAWIEALAALQITGGCGSGNYCPGNPVTRAQMAVFLLKASLGSAYVPPPCTGTVFLDVPCTGGLFDPWIEDLAGRGITGGCGGGNYCPGNPITRGQMAVFLVKTFGLLLYGP